MDPWDCGRYYWGIKVTRSISLDGEIYAYATEVKISPEGALLLIGKDGLPVLVIAPRFWTAFFSASCIDGRPLAAEYWKDPLRNGKKPSSTDPRRTFDADQREEILRVSGGSCHACGMKLGKTWHADHIVPHSKGGVTEIENGMALCVKCNGRKRDKVLTCEE